MNELTIPFVLDQPYHYRKADYECAAWWENHRAMPGHYTAIWKPGQWNHAGVWIVALPATVIDDYFPALFGGVKISGTETKPQHLGESRTIRLTFPVDQFVYDARFKHDADTYQRLGKWTKAELTKEFVFYKNLVVKDQDVTDDLIFGGFTSYAHTVECLHRVCERIQMVQTFLGWHENNYKPKTGWVDPDWKWEYFKPQKYDS